MRKYFFIAMIIFIIPCLFIACDNNQQIEDAIIKIGDTEYLSLAEAINKSDDGDTILVFNDVEENYDNYELNDYTKAKIEEQIYVAYEINKPITIKGVIQNGKRPKIYGSFLINLSDINYKDNFITVENLEIIHDYVSTTDDTLNDKFSSGIRVFEGDANLVDNYIHMSNEISNDIIENNDLQLYYGIMMSRPEESNLVGVSFDYDISGNEFGNYNYHKGDAYSSAFMIVENVDGIGDFKPSKLNSASYNYSLAIYNNNKNCDSIIYACEYDGELNQYKSLITKNSRVVDFSKLTLPESRFLFCDDFINENETLSVDVYGVMIFTKNVKNIEFNLKNKDAKVVVEGNQINVNVIEYNK